MFDLKFKQINRALRCSKFLPDWLKKPISLGQQVYMLRSALRMSQTHLAKRVGTSQRGIVSIEKEEGDPQLSTIKRIAEGLHCDLVLRLVPKEDLEKYLRTTANKKARDLISMSVATANLELQKPSSSVIEDEINKLAEQILASKRSKLWGD